MFEIDACEIVIIEESTFGFGRRGKRMHGTVVGILTQVFTGSRWRGGALIDGRPVLNQGPDDDRLAGGHNLVVKRVRVNVLTFGDFFQNFTCDNVGGPDFQILSIQRCRRFTTMQTTNMTSIYRKAVLITLATNLLSGCAEQEPDIASDWAVNVGGPAYTGADGTVYLADESINGGNIGRLEVREGLAGPISVPELS